MIVSACLFILGFATTWAPYVNFCSFVIRLVSSVFMTSRGIWILIGETFPTRTRAKQGALATGEMFAQLPAFLCLIHSPQLQIGSGTFCWLSLRLSSSSPSRFATVLSSLVSVGFHTHRVLMVMLVSQRAICCRLYFYALLTNWIERRSAGPSLCMHFYTNHPI